MCMLQEEGGERERERKGVARERKGVAAGRTALSLCSYMYTHTQIDGPGACAHMCIHYTHTHTHMYTHMHTHTHTHTHMYTHALGMSR
jgi:hypothetical protein